MLIKIKVDAIGHGLGYNRYPIKFEFLMNVSKDYKEDESWEDTIAMRVKREAGKKNCV